MADEKYHPDGIFAAAKDLHKPLETWRRLLTPEEQADVDLEEKGVPEGVGEARPPGWDDHGGGESIGSLNQVGNGPVVPGRPAGNYYGDYLPHGIRTPIGAVPGYSETGAGAYRDGLDDQIMMAVEGYNAKHRLKPGDSLHLTPPVVKSWIMQESGSSGTKPAFTSDPLQVNTRGDWKNTGADKARLLGLSEDQRMTPMVSIPGGLEWFYHRGAIHDANGEITGFRGTVDALKAYNGNAKIDANGLPHNENYANSILNRVEYGYVGRQK